MQQQTLDRLAMIQNRVQAVLTQTYELHEYSIPRLFIILPKVTRRRDRILKPFVYQFRLYFLCECGAHTMSENSKTQHEIHLANHEGYGLDKSTEFFEKYGTYVLTLIYMVKYGIMAADLVVPPLRKLQIMEGLDMTQKHLDNLKNIGPLVDDAINFLQAQQNDDCGDLGMGADQMEPDKLEVLE